MDVVRSLGMVLLLAACGRGDESCGPRAADFAEGLFYRAGAVLARAGYKLRCRGVAQSGLALSMKSCELAGPSGLARAQDVSVHMALEATRLPLFSLPALRIRVGDLALVRGHGGGRASIATSAHAGKRLPAFVRAMPVRIDMRRVRLRELPVSVQASIFGWPFAEAPHGELRGAARDLRISVRMSKRGGRITGEVAVSAPSLPAPPELQAMFGRRARIFTGGTAFGLVEFDVENGTLVGKLAGHARDLCITHPRLGEGRACGLSARTMSRFGANRHQLYVDYGDLAFGAAAQVKLTLSGAVPLDAQGGALDLDVRVPGQPVSKVLGAIPQQWRTGLRGFVLDGSFSARFLIAQAAGEFTIAPSFGFSDVAVKSAPAGSDPRRLSGAAVLKMPFPYAHTVSLAQEDGYVPLAQLPSVLVDAVRISEDASFFAHDGFDRAEIAKALVDMKEGNGARGASTISQQLAKNLYFDGERNLTRKVEEAIATAALEASLPKYRLLEIYLNVIEWGDGIFGINAAAQRYFHKPAQQLTAEEAVFLAGIIPAPRKVDREMARDGVSAWAGKRAERVARFLCESGRLSGESCPATAAGDDATEL